VSDPTLFQVFADLVVPGVVGIFTLLVSIAALVSSARATRLAHEVERQRLASEESRDRETRSARLQAMAVEEGRALQRWVVESRNARSMWVRSTQPFTTPPPRQPSEEARIHAEAVLQQSVVPGAVELLELTAIDISHRHRLGVDGDMPESEKIAHLRRRSEFDARTARRIREWALDPESRGPGLRDELLSARSDTDRYVFDA